MTIRKSVNDFPNQEALLEAMTTVTDDDDNNNNNNNSNSSNSSNNSSNDQTTMMKIDKVTVPVLVVVTEIQMPDRPCGPSLPRS